MEVKREQQGPDSFLQNVMNSKIQATKNFEAIIIQFHSLKIAANAGKKNLYWSLIQKNYFKSFKAE